MDSPNQDSPAMSSVGASGGSMPPGLTEDEVEELTLELSKVEDEIQTLRQVLSAKERHAMDLKKRLGMTPLEELKQNITKGWQDVQSSNAYLTASSTMEDIRHSDAYKRTQETLSQAGQVTSAAFSSMGSAIRSKFGEMRALPYSHSTGSMRHSLSMPAMRNSPTFKNLGEKMENMKYKVKGDRANGESAHSPSERSPADNAPF
ncbi:tpd52 like 2a isoform X1 [Chanos chanos]|uniref:Tpd52 like 2a isoform X1 n=1 Tax=Chanos chanos TaxID=29144 RepID=A0A6J2W718_CHACN|nr:tumor protein D54-like isoform X1 [Chanos chanos]